MMYRVRHRCSHGNTVYYHFFRYSAYDDYCFCKDVLRISRVNIEKWNWRRWRWEITDS